MDRRRHTKQLKYVLLLHTHIHNSHKVSFPHTYRYSKLSDVLCIGWSACPLIFNRLCDVCLTQEGSLSNIPQFCLTHCSIVFCLGIDVNLQQFGLLMVRKKTIINICLNLLLTCPHHCFLRVFKPLAQALRSETSAVSTCPVYALRPSAMSTFAMSLQQHAAVMNIKTPIFAG